MTSLDNLEKLIQMATIEHMYSMLQKISDNANNTTTDSTISKNCINDKLIKKLQNYDAVISSLTVKVHNLERELEEIKSNTNNNSIYLCQKNHGQQVLTSYPGFSNTSASPIQSTKTVDEEYIRLKIEEKVESGQGSKDQFEEEESEEEDETDDDMKSLEEVLEKTTITQEIQPTQETKEEVEEEFKEVKEEEDEIQPTQETKEEVEEEVKEEEVEEEFKEEEDEVFEIEIDDVTYFATHEENGILYEITSDGDVGEKVGIIKDGEPIFN